jgi:hypothetical protein
MNESTSAGHSEPRTEPARATPELCQVIDSLIESAAVPPEGTLNDIRKLLVDGIFTSDGEMLYPQDRTFLVIELDELIERDGQNAIARCYTAPR